MYKKIKWFNDKLGEILALFLSSMGCFYIVMMMVVVPLFYSHPHDLVGWINYIVQTFFQGCSLPVLGYVSRIGGLVLEKLLRETHDTTMNEFIMVHDTLDLMKQELEIAKSEREEIKQLHKEIKQGMRAIRYGGKINSRA